MSGDMWVSTDTAEIDRLAGGFVLAIDEVKDVDTVLANAHIQLIHQGGGGPLHAEAIELIEAARALCTGFIECLGNRMTALREASAGYRGSATIEYELNKALGGVIGVNALFSVGGSVARNAATGQPLFGPELSALLLGATRIDQIARLTQIITTRMRPDDPVAAAEGFITMDEPVDSTQPAAAGTLNDLAQRIDMSYDVAADESQGAVEIQKVEHADGTVSWVVSIPGTQTLDNPGQPYHGLTNLSAYLGMSSPADSLVVLAMARAGIKPGEPVLLSGHSQGGMTATRLANDPAVKKLFSIQGVVTFGSPVGHIPVADVPTMNVRHVEDGVPALEGTAVPQVTDDQQVVVTRTLEPGTPEHDMATYAETAERIDESAFPALTDWERDTAHLFAGDGDVVTSQVFLGTQN